MKASEIVNALADTFADREEVEFAYLHGSVLRSESPADIDVAVHVERSTYSVIQARAMVQMDYQIPLELDLERALGMAVDLQVLNAAPLSFRYGVISRGLLIIDRNPRSRETFEYLSMVEYFDFRPRRMEYLREAAST